jgi:hypothetical protein
MLNPETRTQVRREFPKSQQLNNTAIAVPAKVIALLQTTAGELTQKWQKVKLISQQHMPFVAPTKRTASPCFQI